MILRARRTWLYALALALCGMHAWMAASVSRTFSTTFDEVAHLTAGYIYWTKGDYRFQPENGNLPQRLAALPLLVQDISFPPASGNLWRTANVWRLGHIFFHESGNDLPAMLAAGRAMNALLSGVLCFVIFAWALALFGPRGALLSLVLAAFSPALLAHGGLITSDSASALGFALATLTWWRVLQRVTPGRILAAGLCTGLLAVSKFSVVLFAPMAFVLVGIRLARTTPLPVGFPSHIWRVPGWHRLPILAGTGLLSTALCVAVIWCSYDFRYSVAAPGQPNAVFAQSWDAVLLKHTPPAATPGPDTINLRPGPVQAFVSWSREHRLLPEAWLYGLAFVEKNARGRMAYFAGEYRITGWWDFFPTLFVLKTTLPALFLIFVAAATLAGVPASRRRVWLYRTSPLLILIAVYGAFSLQSKLNIGHRHLLPVYTALFVIAGGSVLLLRRHRLWAVALVGLLGWQAAVSLRARPDYLAYFNPLTGGSQQAYRLFVDSSLDWGQDLPRLRAWLDQNAGGERIFLSYFGSGNPAYEGIQATRIGDAYFDFDQDSRSTLPSLRGGVYCISATMFSRVYTQVRGPWSDQNEAAYQQLSAWLRHLKSLPPDAPPTWFDGSVLNVTEASARLDRYESLLFSRLCHFLQARTPDAEVGYSILIFRLSDEEVALILKAPLPVLNARILQPAELSGSPESPPHG